MVVVDAAQDAHQPSLDERLAGQLLVDSLDTAVEQLAGGDLLSGDGRVGGVEELDQEIGDFGGGFGLGAGSLGFLIGALGFVALCDPPDGERQHD